MSIDKTVQNEPATVTASAAQVEQTAEQKLAALQAKLQQEGTDLQTQRTEQLAKIIKVGQSYFDDAANLTEEQLVERVTAEFSESFGAAWAGIEKAIAKNAKEQQRAVLGVHLKALEGELADTATWLKGRVQELGLQSYQSKFNVAIEVSFDKDGNATERVKFSGSRAASSSRSGGSKSGGSNSQAVIYNGTEYSSGSLALDAIKADHATIEEGYGNGASAPKMIYALVKAGTVEASLVSFANENWQTKLESI